ncbi:uncharacterized protein LOC118077248 isoform X1 [Zootoca vivipara]|uniref:uncharacterized protein LOC118077248 isoform X1 n=1 Tax=Zootoca vivipara TaxID=8524 RepID=UPI00293B8E83|nr:uncharacterized protein LOC118077248 isoform X1 [Zootoca vivipara]
MKLFKLSLSWTFFLPWLQVPGGDGFLIRNARLEKCIHASSHEFGRVGLADCKPQSAQYHWSWDAATRAIVHWKTGLCLTVPKTQEFAPAQLESCGGDRARQAWVCSRKGHLTLQGLGLHLSTKQEGHKAFLAREKDKFSRWKTATDEIVCAADLAAAPALGISGEEFVDPQVWVPEDKTIALSEIGTSFIDTRPTSPAIVDEPNTTSNLPKNEDVILEAGDERHMPHKKHQRKGAASRFTGTNWKTVILVLSPLAFILGVTILILNIRYNRKKRKQKLSPLKSCRVVHEERPPLPRAPSPSSKGQIIPASPTPSLKHGEILIEWKDGTITPLFDNMNYQIC